VADPIVVVRDVYKEFYRDEITIPVLMGINLEMAAGDFLSLMGPSGSGKSTLLNLVAGLDQPTSGSVTVVGSHLGEMSEGQLAQWRSQHVGFVFQLYNLIPVLTAYENVELPLTLTHLSRRERDEHVRAALEVVGLGDRMDHYPRQLSGGQEQRVSIARAIATDPTLFVADEPTGDLDAKSAGEILDLLERLNRDFGKTIIMVTHDPNAAARAKRLVHLDKGVLEGTIETPHATPQGSSQRGGRP
jgi:putative ABC transport system ATP-binding protein